MIEINPGYEVVYKLNPQNYYGAWAFAERVSEKAVVLTDGTVIPREAVVCSWPPMTAEEVEEALKEPDLLPVWEAEPPPGSRRGCACGDDVGAPGDFGMMKCLACGSLY